MSTLIDALKGLLEVMSEYSAKPTTTLGAEGATSRWQMEIRKIIAEHERSAEPVKLFYQPSDRQVQDLLLALSANAVDHDPEEYGLPCFETDRGTFYDPCSLVELVRQHMSNWREAGE